MTKEPEASEFGGEGYEEIQHGHRFDCANEPGHEEHVKYDDNLRVLQWSESFRGPFKKTGTVNGHPTKAVQRTVVYGPWEDV